MSELGELVGQLESELSSKLLVYYLYIDLAWLSKDLTNGSHLSATFARSGSSWENGKRCFPGESIHRSPFPKSFSLATSALRSITARRWAPRWPISSLGCGFTRISLQNQVWITNDALQSALKIFGMRSTPTYESRTFQLSSPWVENHRSVSLPQCHIHKYVGPFNGKNM